MTVTSAGPPGDLEAPGGRTIAFELPARYGSLAGRLQLVTKRTMDIVGAVAALVVLSPLLAAVAVAVWFDSGLPVLYRWRVVGRWGRPFTGYKFRSMVQDADERLAGLLNRNEMQGPVFKMRLDPRATRVGRFLRRYSLDELPQLWSVIKGDMSLVGPRPPLATEWAQFRPDQWRKLAVTPGMTCLWQVSGRADIRDFDEWVRLDAEYIDRWNLWLDLTILARTILVVVRRSGAY